MSMCWVEHDAFGPCRIFSTHRDAVQSAAWDKGGIVGEVEYSYAVGFIRRRVFERDGWACTHCSTPISWDCGHMHEREWRGRGGEISLDNCTSLCYDCHMNDETAGHGKRRVIWTSKLM